MALRGRGLGGILLLLTANFVLLEALHVRSDLRSHRIFHLHYRSQVLLSLLGQAHEGLSSTESSSMKRTPESQIHAKQVISVRAYAA